jgi:hypothetical protein
MKVHFDCGQVHHGAAAFDLKLQGDSFVRSDAEHRPIRTQGVHGRILEGPVGGLLEADSYLSVSLRQIFAGAQIEGHARPTPIVDLEPQRDKGLDILILRDVRFLP